MTITLLITFVIILALVYTFTNGFQDGSSVVAGPIASGAMSELQAVFLVATFEMAGALFGGSAVLGSMRAITDWPMRPDLLPVLICALLAAIIWNFFTRRLRLPSSSTHALVGGLLGGVIAGADGFSYVVWGQINDIVHSTGVIRVLLSLFISPVIGIAAGYIVILVSLFLLQNATRKVNITLRALQLITVPILAFAHGANDTQKSMAVIVLALSSAGLIVPGAIPMWIRVATGIAMAIGVIALTPGIVKRVGYGIFKLRLLEGLVIEFASEAVILSSSVTGCPVATSQVISSTVMGVGIAKRMKAVHWQVARDIGSAWLMTIPASALLAWLLYQVFAEVLSPIC